jgi:hypothetical protein
MEQSSRNAIDRNIMRGPLATVAHPETKAITILTQLLEPNAAATIDKVPVILGVVRMSTLDQCCSVP